MIYFLHQIEFGREQAIAAMTTQGDCMTRSKQQMHAIPSANRCAEAHSLGFALQLAPIGAIVLAEDGV